MPATNVQVRIPQITSLETAIRLYYERIELSNSDILKLFGKMSSATVVRLKKKAVELMVQNNTPVWNAKNVNTEMAYEAWGLDIKDLERRYEKIKALGR